jgi:hypothetical protein
MWTVLPSSNYYGRSVTIGLAARRRSRVQARQTSERDVGPLFAPLNGLVGRRSMGGGVGRRKCDRPLPSTLPLHAVARSVRFHRWELGFKQSSLGHITRALHRVGFGVFVPTCAFPPCSCSVRLSPSGKTDGPEVSLRTSPACSRDLTRRFHGARSPALRSSDDASQHSVLLYPPIRQIELWTLERVRALNG